LSKKGSYPNLREEEKNGEESNVGPGFGFTGAMDLAYCGGFSVPAASTSIGKRKRVASSSDVCG